MNIQLSTDEIDALLEVLDTYQVQVINYALNESRDPGLAADATAIATHCERAQRKLAAAALSATGQPAPRPPAAVTAAWTPVADAPPEWLDGRPMDVLSEEDRYINMRYSSGGSFFKEPHWKDERGFISAADVTHLMLPPDPPV